MAARRLLGIVFFYLAAFDATMATFEYSFEFGEKKNGSHVYTKDGSIWLFQYTAHINVHVPDDMRVAYVKVNVYAISSPDVDFNEQTNVVTITYRWYQISMSSYSVFALAVAGIKKGGIHVFDKEGGMGLFTYTTYVYFHVPSHMRVSYVKVIVYAISPPKVDFDEVTNVLTIAYSWIQIPLSSYSVSAKAVPDYIL